MTASPSAPARPPSRDVSAGDRAQLYHLLTHARSVRLDQFEALAVRGTDLGSAVLDEIDSHVVAEVCMELSEIEAALLRMSRGTYGACERCREPMPVERLYVRPHARFCGACSHRR